MQSNTGYDDSHLARQAFKKKDAPVRETMAKKVPIQSKVDSKIGGKVILNDQLSMSNKSKTATNISDAGAISGIPPMKEASELSDLLRTSGHSDKFSTISKKSRIPGTDLNHSQSHTSSKHAVSEAETGARTSQAPSQESGQKGQPIKDFLLESGESLKESLGLCEEVFEYVYQDDTGNLDVDSFKKVSKLHKQMDLIMAESLTDEEIDQGLSNHLESLENIRIMIEKREKERAEMDKLASQFMTKNREVADLPKDFDEVLERVSDQVLEERRSRLAEEPDGFNREVDDLGESDMMKVVKDKLMSTFYGFAKQPSTQETIKETLDDAYLKGLERIRELDKQLALREKEEKAIKDMIKLNKKKERELNMQARLNTPSDLENNPSGLTAQSSKSDFFPTQPKKIAKKTSQNAEARTAEATGSKSIVMPGKRPSKLPSRPASHQSQIEALDQGSSQITVDFIKKNIEESYLSEHERFLRSLKPEGRLRYDCLIKEIEEGLDSDDPMEFRRVSQLHYENAYGYPPELQEKFREIDERIVDMLATEENPQEPKPKTKDVIRERVEKKEAKKRLKQIDELVENIRNGEIQLTPEQLREAINHEIAIIDPEIIQSIKNTIDLADFDDWEKLDEEAIELIKQVDVDSIEKYLNDCMQSIEETEKRLKIEEEVHKITDPEAIQRSVAFAEDYSKFLNEQKDFLSAFKIHDRISTEEDFERYEDEVRLKLRENGDMLDKWYHMMEEGREDIDRMCIDHDILLKEVSQLKIRDPEKFDEEVTAELRLKRPDLFNKTYPQIEPEMDDYGQNEPEDCEDEEEPTTELKADNEQ